MADYLEDTPLQVIMRPDPAGLAGTIATTDATCTFEDDEPSARPTLPLPPILQRR